MHVRMYRLLGEQAVLRQFVQALTNVNEKFHADFDLSDFGRQVKDGHFLTVLKYNILTVRPNREFIRLGSSQFVPRTYIQTSTWDVQVLRSPNLFKKTTHHRKLKMQSFLNVITL